MRVVLGNETIGHLPREFSRIAWYFLAHSGKISAEVIGSRRHGKNGDSMPVRVYLLNKLQMKCLEELLAEKIRVYITSTKSNDQQKVSIRFIFTEGFQFNL